MKKQAQLKLVDRTKLQAYLEEEIPIKVICKKLGVSKERARQMERQAMEKLQQLGAGLGLEDFLT